MPRMQTHIQNGWTILGPCPGCETWTVEYDYPTMTGFGTREEFVAAVEHVLQEHLAECRGLQEIVYNTL